MGGEDAESAEHAEAEEMSDRIGILNHGKIVAEGSPSEIVGMVPGNSVITIEAANAQGIDIAPVERLVGVESVNIETSETGSSSIRIEAAAGSEVPVAEVVRNLSSQGAEIGNLGVSRPTLEDAFLRLTSG